MLKVKKNYIRLTTCVIKLGFLINLRIIGEKKKLCIKKMFKKKNSTVDQIHVAIKQNIHLAQSPLLQLNIYFVEQEAYDVHYFIEYEEYEIPVSVSVSGSQ